LLVFVSFSKSSPMQKILFAALLASAALGPALAQVALPPHASTYNGFSRGYNFVANTAFFITALEIPPNAFQAGDTAGVLVRINGTVILRSVGNPTAAINTLIPVAIGDSVDIIGNWSPAVPANFTAHNSYGSGPFATTIEGVPHTLTRCGWQWDIADPNYTSGAYLAPTTGQLGRIIMYTSTTGGGSTLATNAPVGVGCTRSFESFYETFPAGTFDLSNTSLQMIPTGTGYLVIPAPSLWHTPTGAVLPLTDDLVSAALPLGFTLNYPGGSTQQVYVSSNGFIWAQPSLDSGCCVGNPALLLTQGARWCPNWGDLNPALGGAVQFDTDPVAGAAYVTFTNVPEYAAAQNTNTFQVAFFSSGIVEYRFQNCMQSGRVVLTGWSPGTNNANPGSTDLSTLAVLTTGPDVLPLTLVAQQRPLAGSTINLVTGNCMPTAPFGALLVGMNSPNLPLDSLGMAGCTQYSDGLVTLLYLPNGASSVTTVMAVPNLVGLNLYSQSVLYDPISGRTQLGAIASNGIHHVVGNL